MKKWSTIVAERSGVQPKEVDAEVENFGEILYGGVYAVKGVSHPVAVEPVTEFEGELLSERGFHVERGMVFMETGFFIIQSEKELQSMTIGSLLLSWDDVRSDTYVNVRNCTGNLVERRFAEEMFMDERKVRYFTMADGEVEVIVKEG